MTGRQPNLLLYDWSLRPTASPLPGVLGPSVEAHGPIGQGWVLGPSAEGGGLVTVGAGSCYLISTLSSPAGSVSHIQPGEAAHRSPVGGSWLGVPTHGPSTTLPSSTLRALPRMGGVYVHGRATAPSIDRPPLALSEAVCRGRLLQL